MTYTTLKYETFITSFRTEWDPSARDVDKMLR